MDQLCFCHNIAIFIKILLQFHHFGVKKSFIVKNEKTLS